MGEVKDGMQEELVRMKWISQGAVSLVGVVYGSVSQSCRLENRFC